MLGVRIRVADPASPTDFTTAIFARVISRYVSWAWFHTTPSCPNKEGLIKHTGELQTHEEVWVRGRDSGEYLNLGLLANGVCGTPFSSNVWIHSRKWD